jgi:RNA polymerase sigma-70 factor (ECF subfamily)
MAVRRPAAKKPQGEAPGLPQGDDRLLVEAAQKDPSRFAELYELNFARVYGYIARRVGDRDAAQDLTSDVFHKALIVDRSKRGAKEVTGQDLPDLPDLGKRPKLEEADQCARLFGLVGQLPKDQRRVIAMRFAEEKSIREIAQALGRTEGAVKQLQFRALQNLRACMEGANA